MNSFKPAHHTVVSFLFKNVARAFLEEKIFLTFIRDSKSPVELAILKVNTLKCTELDEELEKSKETTENSCHVFCRRTAEITQTKPPRFLKVMKIKQIQL